MGILERIFGGSDAADDPLADEDLASLDGKARAMIRGVVELSETTVKEIMVPRTDVTFVSTDSSPEEIVLAVGQSGHSRIPVFHQTMDNIIGVLYAKDLLRYTIPPAAGTGEDFDLEKITRRAYLVPETKRVDELLREFQLRHVHMAVVVDEYGGTSGVVCMEDVIEEIVGDIQDEFDDEEDEIQQVGAGVYLCDARVRLDELNKYPGLTLPEDDFDTLGGFVFDLFGKIPVKYEKESFGDADFVIQEMEGHRVAFVKIIVHPEVPTIGGVER